MSLRPRVGLLALYRDACNATPGSRREREELARRAGEMLTQQGEVIFPGLVTDEATGRLAGMAFEGCLDVVRVLPCTAVPPFLCLGCVGSTTQNSCLSLERTTPRNNLGDYVEQLSDLAEFLGIEARVV